MDPELKFDLLKQLEEEYIDCQRCGLCNPPGRKRKSIVFGEGNHNASLFIVGEAPGKDEDEKGFPFVGRAGVLLEKLLASCSCSREEVYISNIVMCRPTDPTDPDKNVKPPEEAIKACLPRLHKTIEIVDPFVVLMLGETAMKALSNEKKSITAAARLDGMPIIEVLTEGICVEVRRTGFATFHPSYLLRNDSLKENSDLHRACRTVEKAVRVSDMYNHLYFGKELPRREAEEEDG